MIFKKKIKYILVFLFTALVQVSLNALDLEKGKLKQEEYPKNLADYKEYFLSNQLPGDSFTYLKHNRRDSSYYTLNSAGTLYDVDMTPKTPTSFHFNENIISSWSLMSPAPILAGEQYAAAKQWYELNNPPYNDTPDPAFTYINADSKNLIESEATLTDILVQNQRESQFGCLKNQPLRFGIINGENTLVSIVNENIIFSSPVLKKPIFRLIYAREDETLEQYYLDKYGNKKPSTPQYISESGMSSDIERIYPAQRSYGKLFEGDFNDDQKQDLIMWRKAYKSRLMNDPIIGYELNAELQVHYQLENGEYKLQQTGKTVLQGWLASKNLTWQTGFPSKSECAGQEGQLIPEMHDPLLNDPDVLK